MKLYIAGPMTGIPQFNYPAFDEAAERLRHFGYQAVSPAELDDPETRAAALASPDGAPGSGSTNGETWGDFLARDLKLIADEVDAVAVLPGWEKSRGARQEVFAAREAGKPVYRYDAEGRTEEFPHRQILCQLDVEVTVREARTATGEVRVTNEKTGGQKGSKPQRMELLPWEALLPIAEVYGYGATKYAPNNWRKGYDWSLSFGALQRHLTAFWTGENIDPETGLPHLAHAAFHIFALLVFSGQAAYAELDDRPVPAITATHERSTDKLFGGTD